MENQLVIDADYDKYIELQEKAERRRKEEERDMLLSVALNKKKHLLKWEEKYLDQFPLLRKKSKHQIEIIKMAIRRIINYQIKY